MDEEKHLLDPTSPTYFGRDGGCGSGKRSKVILAIVLVGLVIALLAVFFVGGFVAGQKHARSSVKPTPTPSPTTTSSSPTPTSSPSPTPSPSPAPPPSGFNWGADVMVDGKEMAVVDWLDENMAANNIKNNLL